MAKWVYMFTEGNASMRNLLGGKGANLAEMTSLGLPVPQGFTVTTEACTQYYEDGRQINDEIMGQIMEAMGKLEEITGKKFGDKVNLFFLCETKNIKDARFLFEIYGFDDMAVVDSSINFYDTYKLNPILGKDVVFLLDSTNTILSIGNPNDNLKIDSLFTSLMLGNFSKNK